MEAMGEAVASTMYASFSRLMSIASMIGRNVVPMISELAYAAQQTRNFDHLSLMHQCMYNTMERVHATAPAHCAAASSATAQVRK